MTLPYSQACENNKGPILEVLQPLFDNVTTVLEIGSGTGQHAEFFAAAMPHLTWQTTDMADNLSGIQQRIDQARLRNVPPVIEFDVNRHQLPNGKFDAVFTANTLHIMSWRTVEQMFATISSLLNPRGQLCIYGPFNYGGTYTSGSNELFDQSLRSRNAQMGIRDIEKVQQLAQCFNFNPLKDYQMPANNRLLHFYRR